MITISDKEIENIFNIFFKTFKYDKEEHYGAAAEGFVRALEKFDEDSNVSFRTYAISCMNLEVLFERRKMYATKKRMLNSTAISIDAEINDDGFSLAETIADKEKEIPFDFIEAMSELEKILSKNEFKILKYKMDELTDKEISLKMKIPTDVVSSIHKDFKYNPKIINVMCKYGIM